MTSRDRMLAAIENRVTDYVPCSFMIFFNLYRRCATEREFIEKQLEMGLDATVHVGHLRHSLHPEARSREWVEVQDGISYFCRRIETPKGPLTARVQQKEGWPTTERFPLFDDWIVPRSVEVLVKPEQDLEKIPYLFGPFTDESIEKLRVSAREAERIAEQHRLLLTGGWRGIIEPGQYTDAGVMGADAMAWLSGYEQIMVLSLTHPELVKEYVRIIHEWNLRQLEIYLDVTKADLIMRRGWYETTEFWTPRAYHDIIAPTLKEEARLVHQAGRKYGYIITSAFLPLLNDILDAGIDVLVGLDPKEGKGTDLVAVKAKLRDKKRAVWGGVSGAISVEQGSATETEAAVVEAIRTLGGGGGFILSPVDNVREDTETAWRNTGTFIETWKRNRKKG